MDPKTTFVWLYVLFFHLKCLCEAEEEAKFLGDDQELIDSLRKFEFIQPNVNHIDLSTDVPAKVRETFLSFSFRGTNLTLKLSPNRNLFSKKYFERDIIGNGSQLIRKNSHFCFFHGHVEGHKDESVVAISTCDGVNGYFTLLHKTFFIQPVTSIKGEVFHVAFESEDINLPKYKCGHSRTEPLKTEFEATNSEAKNRVRRDVLSETKYLEMVIINDVSQYRRYPKDTNLRTKSLANIIDSVYRAHNIRVVLILIETWKNTNKFTVSSNAQKTLDNLEDYKKNTLDKDESTKNDNAQLLTILENLRFPIKMIVRYLLEKGAKLDLGNDYKWAALMTASYWGHEAIFGILLQNNCNANVANSQQVFSGNVVGKASTLSICSSTSTALIRDHSKVVALTASTMAHELGHNFGLNHDEAMVDGNCECGVSHGCVMASQLKYTPLLKFSNCSLATLKKTLLSNYGTCLFDQPIKHIRHGVCGNAFVDEGEECDCGTKEECERNELHDCCNHTTCHFTPHSKCSDGPCCQNCQIKPKGALCRGKVNDCDLPEYCDGKHSICAPDSYVHNGRPCGNHKGLCYLGVCHTLEDQCRTFWGAGSTKAHSHCYVYLNTRPDDKYGHCKKLSNDKYMACKKEDVYCGKLQCDNPGRTTALPIIGTDRKAHHIDVGKQKCWSGVVYMGDDIPEPGMVQTGTKCGANKVCWNNTCVSVDTAYKQPRCRDNCSRNGICNNHGHCHCNYGYKCPDCIETCSGEGGSLESGNGCSCSDVNPTVSTTSIPSTTEDVKTTVSTVFTTIFPSTTEDVKTTVSTAFITVFPSTTEDVKTTVSTAFTTIFPSTTEGVNITVSTAFTTNIPTTSTTTGGGEVKKGELATVVIVVIVLTSILLIVGGLLCYRYRDIIGENFRNTRQSTQKKLNAVTYNREHRTSQSSGENLTDESPNRPTRLEIGRPMSSDVTITPDCSDDKRPNGLTPSPLTPESKPVPSYPGAPKLSPSARATPSRPLLRPLGPRNKSLPDLLEDKSLPQRPSPPSKAQSFNAHDKPGRPKVPKLPSAQASNAKTVAKPNKHPPSTPDKKPGTNLSSDPFNRSELRKTPVNPKPKSDVSRPYAEAPVSGDNRPTVGHTFRPSDLKTGKSPFSKI